MSFYKPLLTTLAAWVMAIGLTLTARPVQAQAQPATDVKAQTVMGDLLHWLNTYKSLTANFHYSVAQSGGKPQNGEGHILLNGRSYRMQIDGTVFLCDGKQLTVYQPDLEEATLQAYDPTQDELNPFLWLANYEKRFRSKYIRLQNQNGGLQDVVDLLPTQAAPFLKIRLFVQHNTHQLNGMELYDTQDRIYSYKISDFVYNPPVKPGDFTFDPALYPDVLVNDMR
ncbi:MAG: outer membrane lipoprotein carrier protein LolA [Bacteroidales bacterium]|nr:outer membrane lipoprotein carrier protein LolA [Bacteroidales bacterium]